MARSPLHDLEKEADRLAQEYKRKLIEDGMKELAAREAEGVFPPQGDDLPPHQDAPPADPLDRGTGGR